VPVVACVWAACNIYTPDLLSSATVDGSDAAADVQPTEGGLVDVPGDDGCAPSVARCGSAQCTVQLIVDPKNCGVCGHDCQGAPCLNAQCQPLLVAGQQSAPAYLAVDDTSVYWTNSGDGTIWRANKDGTSRVQIASGRDNPWIIKVRNNRVYWSEDTGGGSVVSAPVGGGGPLSNLSGPQPSPRGFAVDDTHVYFVTEGADAGSLQRVQLDGGGLAVLAGQQGSPKEVVLTPTSAFWTVRDDGTIMRYQIGTGAIAPILQKVDTAWGLTFDGTFLYFTSHSLDAGAVGRVGTDGTGENILASAQSLPRAVAVDTTHAYFTNEGEGTVKRVPVAGGALVTLASGQVQPWGIAVDDQFVYWAAKGAGTVLKVAK
jgi:hypothetical protein